MSALISLEANKLVIESKVFSRGITQIGHLECAKAFHFTQVKGPED